MLKLLKAAGSNQKDAARVINVTSESPILAGMRWSDLNFEKINKDLLEAEQPPYDMHKTLGGKGEGW